MSMFESQNGDSVFFWVQCSKVLFRCLWEVRQKTWFMINSHVIHHGHPTSIFRLTRLKKGREKKAQIHLKLCLPAQWYLSDENKTKRLHLYSQQNGKLRDHGMSPTVLRLAETLRDLFKETCGHIEESQKAMPSIQVPFHYNKDCWTTINKRKRKTLRKQQTLERQRDILCSRSWGDFFHTAGCTVWITTCVWPSASLSALQWWGNWLRRCLATASPPNRPRSKESKWRR